MASRSPLSPSASASPSPSPTLPLSCPVCSMFIYNSASFYDSSSCHRHSTLVEMETRLKELESCLSALLQSVYTNLAAPEQPGSSQGSWVTVHSQPPVHHQPVHVTNRFFPLSNTPTDKQALVMGDSILRNVKLATQAVMIKCTPGGQSR